MKLECFNNKLVVSCKVLGTPIKPAVLEDPPSRSNEDVTKGLSFRVYRLRDE